MTLFIIFMLALTATSIAVGFFGCRYAYAHEHAKLQIMREQLITSSRVRPRVVGLWERRVGRVGERESSGDRTLVSEQMTKVY